MANVVKIEVQLDSASAVAGAKQLGDALKGVGSSAVPASTALGAATRETRGLTTQQEAAKRALELLAGRLGIELPRAAQSFIVSLKGIAPVLAAAFSASAVIAIGVALFEAGKGLYEWITSTKEAEEATKKLREEQDKLNASYEDYVGKMEALRRQKALVPLEGVARTGQEATFGLQDLNRAKAELDAMLSQYNRLYLAVSKTDVFGKFTPAAIAAQAEFAKGPADKTSPENQAMLAREAYEQAKLKYETQILQLNKENTAEAAKQYEIFKKLAQEVATLQLQNEKAMQDFRSSAQSAWEKSTGMPRAAGNPSAGELIKSGLAKNQAGALAIIKGYQDAQGLSSANAAMSAQLAGRAGNPWAVTEFEIAQLEKSKQLYADNAEAIAAIEDKKKLLIMQTNMEIAEDAKAKFEKSAQAIEGFFQRVFLSAKSFGDVWKQLWTQSVGWVVSQFSRMVAGWLNAHQQMAGVAGGGGGGGMVMGGGATGTSFASAGLGMITGGGGGSGGGFSLDALLRGSGGGGGGTGSTGGGGLSGNPMFNPGGGMSTMGLVTSAGMMGGMMLANYGVGKGNPILGGIGGFFTGGFAGMTLGSTSALAGTWLGAWAGPIGAGIGAAVGVILALRKRGQQQKAAAAVQAEYMAVAAKAVNDFNAHKATYETATGGLTSVFQQAVQQLGGLGGAGQSAIGQITSNYTSVLAQMDKVNLARGYRTATIAGLPVPQFAMGSAGIIPGSGPFAAVIHGGEAVLNPEAAAKLGGKKIKALNEGGSSGGDTFIINAMDTRGFADFLKRNRATVIKFIQQQKADRWI